jgi:hypothetical protein
MLRTLAPLLAAAAALLLCRQRCSAQTLEGDTVALLAFKAGGDRDDDLNLWLRVLGEPCGDGWNDFGSGWVGVRCDAEGGRVTEINLSNKRGLSGSLESLAALTALTYLSLAFCSAVSGDVGSLAGLTQLTQLGLYGTSTGGSVEPLVALTRLTVLSLGGTSVGGSVEPLVALTQLKDLFVQNTNVHGSAALIQANVPKLSGWGSAIHDFSACSDWTGNCTAGAALVDSPGAQIGRTASACCVESCASGELEPEPELEHAQEARAEEKLRAELGGLKLGALNKRAMVEGVEEDVIEDAMASDDPKASLTDALVEKLL